VLLVNFKTYKEATGAKAIALAKLCEKIAKESKVIIIPIVQVVDLDRVKKSVSIPVYVQHIDPIPYGQGTGSILPEAVKETGASGTLLNHAEKQISMSILQKSITRAKEVGLKTVVCINNYEMAEQVANLHPDYIAIEPPELIGGNISVSTAKPEVITKTIKRAKGIPVLCGAGVKTNVDIKKALQYGAKGILLASGITKAEDPEKALRSLVKGFL